MYFRVVYLTPTELNGFKYELLLCGSHSVIEGGQERLGIVPASNFKGLAAPKEVANILAPLIIFGAFQQVEVYLLKLELKNFPGAEVHHFEANKHEVTLIQDPPGDVLFIP